MKENYLVWNWHVRKWRGNGDVFYTSHKHLARRFATRHEADLWCGPKERVERVIGGSLIESYFNALSR